MCSVLFQRQQDKIETEVQQNCVIQALDTVTEAIQMSGRDRRDTKFGWDSLFMVTCSQHYMVYLTCIGLWFRCHFTKSIMYIQLVMVFQGLNVKSIRVKTLCISAIHFKSVMLIMIMSVMLVEDISTQRRPLQTQTDWIVGSKEACVEGSGGPPESQRCCHPCKSEAQTRCKPTVEAGGDTGRQA